MKKIKEWKNITKEQFLSEIVPLYQPAILKNVVSDWPLLDHSKQSASALCNYFRRFDCGAEVGVFSSDVKDMGEINYNDDFQSFNFSRTLMPFDHCLAQIEKCSDFKSALNVYMGSMSAERCTPGLKEENPMPLLPASVTPRLWIGNKSVVQPHFDVSDNIAVVVAGKRRFTLFPPEQINNLYIGPIDATPAGQPMSVVSLTHPDIERYPRYKEALAVAREAELEAGDAIFIPSLWWHGVEGLEKFNALVNYWWNQNTIGVDSAHEAMIHGILTISQLPLAERRAWKAFFDHYVFQENEHPLAHLPETARGVLATMTPELYRIIRSYLHVRMGVK